MPCGSGRVTGSRGSRRSGGTGRLRGPHRYDGRYDRTAQALDAISPWLAGCRAAVRDTHVDVRDAALIGPTGIPVPIFFGGASPAARQVAARQADTYLLWSEPLPQIAARISGMRELAAAHNRSLRFGLRMHVLARETAEGAWAEAHRIQAGFDPAVVESVQRRMPRMDSVGQAWMASLHGGATLATWAAELTVGPKLWSGIGLVREGAGPALVGSYDEVAARLDEYSSVGVDEFIVSGYPHREEALRVGRHVLPRVARSAR